MKYNLPNIMPKEFKNLKEKDLELVSQEVFDIIKKHMGTSFVIFLNGDLGAGKTTLAKNLGKVLGIQKIIISPTFILRKDYPGQAFNLIHIDGYRFETPEESKVLELDSELNNHSQSFNQTNHSSRLGFKKIILIEWAEKFKDFYNLKADLEIDIKPSSEFSRDFILKF